jgi:hypothetical protein
MERAARSLSDHQHRHPAVGQRSHAASDAEFVDNRPDAISQRTLAAAVNQSPQGTAQRAFHTAIHRSPYMVAQRNKLRGAFGATTQLEEGQPDESFEQLPPEAYVAPQAPGHASAVAASDGADQKQKRRAVDRATRVDDHASREARQEDCPWFEPARCAR